MNTDNKTKKTGAQEGTKVSTGAPAAHVEETNAMPSTERNAGEGSAAIADAPVVVNAGGAAASQVVKTRLFWQKACNDSKQSTNTEIKPGEIFVKTDKQVWALPDGTKPQNETDNAPVLKDVYSLKRGKRIYYTFYVTPEQIAEATKAGQAKAEAKAAADKIKADEKAKKEAEKAAKAGNTAAAVQPSAMAAPAAITEEEISK